MDALLNSLGDVVEHLSSEKIGALANRLRMMDDQRTLGPLLDIMSTSRARQAVKRLGITWQDSDITPGELASMLVAASYAYERGSRGQVVELVWTGPTTSFASTRRTDQSLLEVIRSANETVFVTSFVAYDVTIVVTALNEAAARGVEISMLLESSLHRGGSLAFDAIGLMRSLVPSAKLYAWTAKQGQFDGGRVHAKVAVSDGTTCFITSANLTGHALERNMEAGILIRRGSIPDLLQRHLNALVETGIVSTV